jgi:cbb3-type cytochrome oxidase maturation protein
MSDEGAAMSGLLYLIPAALFLGACGLAAFMWAMRSGQFDDLDGAAHRVLFDEDPQAGNSDGKPDGTPEAGSDQARRDSPDAASGRD